jgi:hypothetical protein
MTKEPALTHEQAESLVQGEEYRLLIRNGQEGYGAPERKKLIAKVAKAATFEKALEIIAATIEE